MATKPARSPEREKLATAIQAKAVAARDLDAAKAAKTKLRQLRAEARSELSDLTASIDQERRASIARELGGEGDLLVDFTADEARAKTLEARIAYFEQAAPDCDAAVVNAEETLRGADKALTQAVSAVEYSAVPTLLAEAQAIQTDLVKRREVLLRLATSYPTIGYRDFEGPYQATPMAAAFRAFVGDGNLPTSSTGTFVGLQPHSSIALEARSTWEAAHEALMHDADAPLPVCGV